MKDDLPPSHDPDLAAPGALARYPLLGFGVALIAMLVFAFLAWDVISRAPLTLEDALIVRAIHLRAVQGPPLIVLAMRISGFLGEYMIVILSLILGIFWLRRRAWRPISLLVVGVVGGELLFQVLSLSIGRQRPQFPDPLEVLTVPGFPSGHTLTSVVLYGLLVYLFVPRLASRVWRALTILLGVLLIVWIAAGRVYLGSHYPTDVVAGAAAGLAWGGCAYTTIELAWQRRRDRSQAARRPGSRPTTS